MTRFITPVLDGPTMLVEIQGLDEMGPIRPDRMIIEHDGAVVFPTDGLPIRIGVIAQDGDILTIQDGSRWRIEPVALTA